MDEFTGDTRWRTGNVEIDAWIEIQHAQGKHAPNCPKDCQAALRPSPMVKANGQRRFRLTRASEIIAEPVDWLWDKRIPAAALTTAAGREGSGKSTWLSWLGAKITRGQLPGKYHGKPMPILYVSVEESWAQAIRPKLQAAGADLELVHRLDVEIKDTDGDIIEMLDLPGDNRLLEKAIAESGAVAVFIDPLLSVLTSKIDSHKEREVRTVLDPLARIADRTGCAIIGICHFSKASSTDVATLITGSGAFKNVPRAIFGFAGSQDGSEHIVSQVKNSLGPTTMSLSYRLAPAHVVTPTGVAETASFDVIEETERHVSDLLGEQQRPNASNLGDRSAMVLGLVCGSSPYGVRAEQVVELLPELTIDDAGKYLRRLHDSGRIRKIRRGLYGPLSDTDPGPSGVGGTSEVSDKDPPKRSEPDGSDTTDASPPSRSSVRKRCQVCGLPLPDWVVAEGFGTHASCDNPSAPSEEDS